MQQQVFFRVNPYPDTPLNLQWIPLNTKFHFYLEHQKLVHFHFFSSIGATILLVARAYSLSVTMVAPLLNSGKPITAC